MYDTEREKHNKAKLELRGSEIALESLESRIIEHEKNKLAWGKKYEFQNYELKCREIKIKNLNLELEKAVKERDELKDKIAKWEESTKNLEEILKIQMSARDKTGLGYSTQLNELSSNHETDSENSLSIFDGRSSDDEHIPENDRFSKNGYKFVPPPITGDFLTPRANISFSGESVVSNPKINKDSIIIKDWTSNDEEEVSGVQKVRLENQTIKTRDDKSGQNSHKQGVGFRKVKACFVCRSTKHLIKDCNFHDKKSRESNLKNVVNTGKRESKPVWDNTKRVNHPNFSKYPHLSETFVPAGVSIRTSLHRPSINIARSFCTARPSINTARPVSTVIPSISTARLSVSIARPSVSTTRPVYAIRPTYPRVQNMTIVGTRAAVNTGKGKLNTDLKRSKWVWRPKGTYLDHVSNDNGSFMLKKGNPEILLQDHAVVDSGCSSHMTGNKAYLSDYEDFNGGFVAFGSDPKGGKITGKGSSGKDKGPTQEYILLPLQPHRTRIPVKDVVQDAQEKPSENASSDKDVQDSEDAADKEEQHQMQENEKDLQDELEMMVTQELAAKAMDDVSRQAFEEEKRRIASQGGGGGGGERGGVPFVSTDRSFVSTDRSNTPNVSAASTSTGANADESSFVYLGGKIPIDASTLPNADLPIDPNMPALEDASDTLPNDGIFNGAYDDDEDVGAEADFNNMDNTIAVSPIPILRIHKDHPKGQILGDPTSAVQTRGKIQKASSAQQALKNPRLYHKALQMKLVMQCRELLQFKLQKVWVLVDLPYGKKVIGTKWVFRNKRDERSIVVKNKAWLVAQGFRQEEGIDYDEVFAPVARIEAIRLFLAFASYMGFTVYQMDVKSAFLYGTIEEEVYVHQPPGFVDPVHPNKVYKSMCTEFEDCLHKRFQMSSMGELTFFLGLQVKQRPEGIFISQDKYVADILKKSDFLSIRTATTPIESNKPLVKDEDGVDVDVHVYRSMIGSLMYLTASRPDIMFAVCACARFQVTPKASHLNAVKRIFRYLKHQPKLGLWYPRDSPFELEAYSDSDYGGASLDRKSTTGGCQFLGRRLISWQCKKQTIVANSTTEAEYVTAANCCGQLLGDSLSETKLPKRNVVSTVCDLASSKKLLCTSYDPLHSVMGTTHCPSPWEPLDKNCLCNTSGSAEDSMQLKELMDIIPKLVTRIETLETELQQTKTTYGKAVLTLVKRVKILEKALKRKIQKVVISESEGDFVPLMPAMLVGAAMDPGPYEARLPEEGEEPEDQERIIQDIDDDPLVSLVRESMKMKEKSIDFVTPTKALGEAQEEDISPTILEAAKTLSKVASQGVSKILKKRLILVEMKLILVMTEVSTGSTKVDSGTASKRGQREGKLPNSKRMAEEEALSEQQKKRKAQVQFEAQYYTEEDWDAIRAKLEANAELTKDVLGKDLPEQDFAKRMVDMVNQRKKHFAEEKAKAKRNKPMTQSQLRIYMSNYLKNQGTWKLSQLKNYKGKIEKIWRRASDKNFKEETKDDDKMSRTIGEKVAEVKEEEPVKRTRKRKKQKARKGISVDKNAQGDSETDKEESVEAMNPTPLATKSNIMKYRTNRPEDAYDRVLRSDLRTMFDPPLNKDAIWSLPLQQKMINWRYYPTCAVHCLTLEASTIYMLADRKYPLSKDACQVMLKMKLLD
ncbi:putative ribonuclease H-like domain-containing protein [Tanacetum coccineum]